MTRQEELLISAYETLIHWYELELSSEFLAQKRVEHLKKNVEERKKGLDTK